MAENNKTVRSEGVQDTSTATRTAAGKRQGGARKPTKAAMFNAFDVIVILLVVAVVVLAIVGLSVGDLFSDDEGGAAQLS